MPHDPFYTSTPWRAFRSAVLRERPACQAPGCAARSSHLDHVTSRRKGGAPLSRENVQALCAKHHSAKTVAVDGGFGRKPAAAWKVPGATRDGWPIDPSHHWNAKP